MAYHIVHGKIRKIHAFKSRASAKAHLRRIHHHHRRKRR